MSLAPVVEPQRRKVILILSNDQYSSLERTSAGQDLLLNKQVYVLVRSHTSSADLVKKLESQNLAIEPGTILLQSPYYVVDEDIKDVDEDVKDLDEDVEDVTEPDFDQYQPLDAAVTTFALAKHYHFLNICRLLGATDVTLREIENTTTDEARSITASFKKMFGWLGGSTSKFESKAWSEIKKSIEFESKFRGSKPRIKKAKRYLYKHNLRSDITLSNLIKQRSDVLSPVEEQKITLNLSKESKEVLKIVANLNIPTYAKLQAEIKDVRKMSYTYTLKADIKFNFKETNNTSASSLD